MMPVGEGKGGVKLGGAEIAANYAAQERAKEEERAYKAQLRKTFKKRPAHNSAAAGGGGGDEEPPAAAAAAAKTDSQEAREEAQRIIEEAKEMSKSKKARK